MTSTDNRGKCCMPGCNSRAHRFSLYRLPNVCIYEDIFHQWLDKIGRPELRDIPPQTIRAKCRVCEKHFRKQNYIKDKLKYNSVPDVYVPEAEQNTPLWKRRTKSMMNTIFAPTPPQAPGQGEIVMTMEDDNTCEKNENTSSEADKCAPSPLRETATTVEDVNMSEKRGNTFSEAENRAPCLSHETATTVEDVDMHEESGDTSRVNCEPSPSRRQPAPEEPVGGQNEKEAGGKVPETLPETSTNANKESVCTGSSIDPILRSLSVSRPGQLSPQAKKLYYLLKSRDQTKQRLQLAVKKLKQRLSQEQRIDVPYLMSRGVNRLTAEFIELQLTQQKRKPRGRRYTTDIKALGDALLKRSPEQYESFNQTFCIPHRTTIKKVVHKIPLNVGINENIFECLRRNVSKMKPDERLCYLTFNDFELEPDQLDEKENTTNGESKAISAPRVTIFMACGITSNWKQPLAFYLNETSMDGYEVAVTIQSIYHKLTEIGLQILATVCDPESTAAIAIQSLIEETKRECEKKETVYMCQGFCIDGGPEVVVLYDVPHLLKCTRNTLIEKDVVFACAGQTYRGSWKDVLAVYTLDRADSNARVLPDVHSYHVRSAKLRKTKVSVAAQIFSCKYSAVMKLMMKTNCNELAECAGGTAEFLRFFDSLFDSLNGPMENRGNAEREKRKPLRRAVAQDSPHHAFWAEALYTLSSMYFVGRTGKRERPPFLERWMDTIRGFQRLWQTLNSTHGLSTMKPRFINQDALENLSVEIRSLCRKKMKPSPKSEEIQSRRRKNKKPSLKSFVDAFKTCLVHNSTSKHSTLSNCEDDFGVCVLTDFHELLLASNSNNPQNTDDSPDPPDTNDPQNIVDSHSINDPQNVDAE